MLAHIAESGICCGFFSLEMSAEEIDDRFNSAVAGINSAVLRFGRRIDETSWARLIEAFEAKAQWPLFIDDSPATISELKRRARLMRRAGAKIIFVDQLSHIRPGRESRGKSTWELNSHIVQELAHLKKELRLPIVLLAQLNRELEKRSDRKPMLADLKNTGALEEHADIVLLGYREYLHTRKLEDEAKAQWEIAKHRGGPTWTIPMQFDGRRTRFYEVESRKA
jgi:replicative DNA helicase